ncbi:endonuclease [Salisaeta longa]|uniref:endonuclease n=1 Tax=Salisaeta longa TaxID=503170 RepID=UPI0003B645DB|nr:endonuclease [Salisaeta longa]
MHSLIRRCTLGFVALLLAVGLTPDAHAQVQSIADARAAGVGASVTVEGTVTRAFGAYVRLQDTSGPTGASALVIRQTSGTFNSDIQDGTIQRGTQLRVSGTLSAFNGLLQINGGDLSSYTVQGAGTVPAPQDVTLGTLASDGEDYESELVRIDGLTLTSSGTFEAGTTYQAYNGTRFFDFRVQGTDESALDGTPIPPGAFTYTGVVGQFAPDGGTSSGYQLIPVRPSDLADAPSVAFNRLYDVALEADGAVSVTVRAQSFASGQSASVTVSAGGTATAGTDATGLAGSETFTLSDTNPARTLTLDPQADGTDEGVERLELTVSSPDVASGLPQQFTLWILDSATATTTLYPGLEGAELLTQIRQDFGDPTTLGYGIARDTLYGRIYNENGQVEGIYTGLQATIDGTGDPSQDVGDEGMNTEHTWPQSLGAGEEPARSNIHILRPSRGAVNSARSNYPYADIPDSATDTWYILEQSQSTIPASNIDGWSEANTSPSDRDDHRFEPREVVKGNVARAALYFRAIYPDRANLGFFNTQRATLLQWNAQDAPDAEEVRRNAIIASYQDNKLNPFIVDPTLAERAFGIDASDVISLAEARSQPLGTAVTTKGLVTRIDGSDTVYLQDGNAGIAVFSSAMADGVAVGDSVRVTGVVDVFAGLLQLAQVGSGYTVQASGQPLPAPTPITLAELANGGGEAYESELVEVTGLTFEATGSFAASTNYTVTGSQGATGQLRVPEGSPYAGASIPSIASFTGVLGQYNDAPDSVTPNEGYQLMALREGDLEGITRPSELSPSITRAFDGLGDAANYRLIALPGQVEVPLQETLFGDAGVDWQAVWDNGQDSNYFVRFQENPDRFQFAPGRGFWFISAEDWTFSGTIPTVALQGGTAEIPLHDGWNIIANPLGVPVPWSAVETANGGTLQPLWAFDGTFAQAPTFASAVTGEAFYFLNDAGLEALRIPYPTGASANALRAQKEAASPDGVMLTAQHGAHQSRVRLRWRPEAAPGADRYDVYAPAAPGRVFALRLQSNTPQPRRAHRATDVRPLPSEGATYPLSLQGLPEGAAVRLQLSGNLPQGYRAAVLDTRSGQLHRLQAPVTLRPAAGLALLVGTPAYLNAQQQAAAPSTFGLKPAYPNPVRRATTFRYSLPEAARVQLTIYDVLGRAVQRVVQRQQAAGNHEVTWRPKGLASGLYLVRLQADADTATRKIMVVQ